MRRSGSGAEGHGYHIRLGSGRSHNFHSGWPMGFEREERTVSLSSDAQPNWPTIRVGGVLGLAVAIVGLASLFRPPSYDELYWLTVARRMVGSGDLPYFDVLDNKGPLVYVIFALFDLLPGSVRLTLTVQFTALLSLLTWSSYRLSRQTGQRPGWAVTSAGVVCLTTSVLTIGATSTELISLALVVTALASHRPWIRVALCLCAALADPRAALFVPVVLWHGHTRLETERRHWGVAAGAALTAASVVLLVDPLQLAFVDLGAATRALGTTPLDGVFLFALIALLPTLMLVLSARSSVLRGVGFFAIGLAITIGLISPIPFGHYWIYSTVALPLAALDGTRFSPQLVGATVLATLLLLMLAVSKDLYGDLDITRRVGPTVAPLAAEIAANDRVVVWSEFPHMRYEIANRTIEFAPTSNYLGWRISTDEPLIERFAGSLSQATVIVVEASLDDEEIGDGYHSALGLILERIADAHCTSEVGAVTVYRFEGCDPADVPTG